MKKQKGITLIALIITIIVMLILVGVSVSVALNGGLFKTAKQAAEQTKTAIQEESSLKYEYEIAKATGGFTGNYDEYILQEKYGLKIGAKVNYNAGDGEQYTTDTSKGIGASVTEDYQSLISGVYTLKGTNNTIECGELSWRVLGINDQGQIELISETPTESTIEIRGSNGNANAINELNNFCDKIYGKGEKAVKAINLTDEDISKFYTNSKMEWTYEYPQIEFTESVTITAKTPDDYYISYLFCGDLTGNKSDSGAVLFPKGRQSSASHLTTYVGHIEKSLDFGTEKFGWYYEISPVASDNWQTTVDFTRTIFYIRKT